MMTKEIMAECLEEAYWLLHASAARHTQATRVPAQAQATLAAELYAERMRREALPVHPFNEEGPTVPTVTTTTESGGATTWAEAEAELLRGKD